MKIPEPRKLPSGNWFIQLRLNGVSIPITAETKTECVGIAELTKAEYRAGKRAIKKIPKKITLRDAIERYINQYKSTLSPSTADRYSVYKEGRFKAYLDKSLGEIPWQRMIDEELKKVSPKTVQNAWGLVRPSLKFVGYPVPEVKLAQVPVKEIAFLQPEEIKPFCEALKGRPYEIAALIELHGLRLSELRALDWKNIDLKKGVINVKGAMVKGSDGYVDKATNKNRTSTRPVPIMIPQLLTALKAVKNKTGKVVTISPSVLLRDVKRACKYAKVTEVTNHGLRHSFASLCYHLEIPDRQIQEWGGWKDREILHRIYIRLSASSETKYKKAVQKFFR